MIETCCKCGMIRATKDLVLREDGNYMCFSCWNELNKVRSEKTREK